MRYMGALVPVLVTLMGNRHVVLVRPTSDIPTITPRVSASKLNALDADGKSMLAEGQNMAEHGRVMVEAAEAMIARHAIAPRGRPHLS